MKALILVAIGFLLVGCALPKAARQISNPPVGVSGGQTGFGQAQQTAGGSVPVVFVNPSPGVYRHVWLFEGSQRVEVIPDPRGGWMFNRPAMTEFKIDPAHSRDWQKDAWQNLSRNSQFVVYEQAERIVFSDPVGEPFVSSFRTGSNPSATTYYKRSPTEPRVQCGGVVQLPHREDAGPTQWRPRFEFNPGAVLKRAIFGGGR